MFFLDNTWGQPLPITDAIGREESGNGYALRMLELNAVPFSDLANLISSPGHRYVQHEAANKIAFLFGAEPSSVQRAIPKSFKRDGLMQVWFMGHQLTRTYLIRHTRPQLCPLCITETGYAKAVWDLSLTTACPTHKIRLIDRCPACDRRLAWRRPGLNVCWCNTPFSNLRPNNAHESEIWLSQTLESKLVAPSGSPSVLNNNPKTIMSLLSLDCLMRLIRCLGVTSIMKNNRPVPGKVTGTLSTAQMSEVVISGLDRWPDGEQQHKRPMDKAWDLKHLLAQATVADWPILTNLLHFATRIEEFEGLGFDGQLSLDFTEVQDA